MDAPCAYEELDDRALDELPFGVVRLDPRGRIEKLNAYEARRSGIQRWRALGRDYVKDIAGADSELARRVQAIAPGECDRVEHTFRGYHRVDRAVIDIARSEDGHVWLQIRAA